MTDAESAQAGRQPGRGARYLEIEATLRREISAGTYAVGARLPTEHELCERFTASRFTVRQALAGLREDGLIEARAGVGTIVVASRKRDAFVHKLSSIEELLQYPSETYRQPLRVDRIVASPELAMLLKCKVGQPWVHLKALRRTRSSQTPIAYFDIYVLPAYAGVLDRPNPEGAPVVRQIEEALGVRAAHAQIEIFVGHITPELAEPLMARQDDPALIIIRRYRGTDGAVFLVTYSVHPENRFSLNIEFERR
ncbi:GntR family transcriptional regulator [Ancylobacter sp. MQZ15Z-1]|uniref:GntR family transcriptional regulator n=1 Tax=Ancylobacter mangrovi TaxID=2972472 RepID=A0A9X2PG14_9HYPH|nr:GntR family transcriptional regulator [Ancylobacter mangrovi]MCS0496306.1 GntR family transcriptional regulator [Ancylobacter mangrovi]